jgi:predicted nucleic acid binding AN1-type Zn finger protein
MATLIAACGLDCAKCDAYIATQANDQTALEKLVEKWRVEFNAPNLTVATVLCDGCMSGGRTIGYCAECKIRLCAVERGLENCAACPDYGCEKLTAFWPNALQAKANLEAIHKGG